MFLLEKKDNRARKEKEEEKSVEMEEMEETKKRKKTPLDFEVEDKNRTNHID